MQIKETIGVSFPVFVERPRLEDVVMLVDRAGVALEVQRVFSARVSGVRDGGSSRLASGHVEIPLVRYAGAARGFVDIVVAVDGVGMTGEVFSQAFTPYFTTKPAGSGTGVGLPQVEHFAAERGGAVWIESERGAGTLVRLFLPRVHAAGLLSSIVGTKITYTPTPNGGVFHVIDPATAAPTS